MENEAGGKRPRVALYVLLALLIVTVGLDACGTWQNNQILKGRDAKFERIFAEHAELKGKCE